MAESVTLKLMMPIMKYMMYDNLRLPHYAPFPPRKRSAILHAQVCG